MNHPWLTVLLFIVAVLATCLGLLVNADPRATGGPRASAMFGVAAVCGVLIALVWRL